MEVYREKQGSLIVESLFTLRMSPDRARGGGNKRKRESRAERKWKCVIGQP